MDELPAPSQVLPGRSCVACKRRKIRCDRQQPCNYCARLRLPCVYPGPDQQKRKPPENDILSRLERIEASLQRLESNITQTRSSNPIEGAPSPINTDQETSPESRATSESGNGKLVLKDGDTRYVTSSFWADLDEENGDGASESEYPLLEPSLVPSNSTAELRHGRGFPFGFNSVATDLRQLHPVANRTFTLWQVFLESVDPVLKIIHVPVTQRQVLKASQNLAAVPPAFESLMFAIYYSAVSSMQCSVSSRTLLHEERHDLLNRYRLGVELALTKANLMSAPDVTTLQALTLYLICARHSADKTYVWSMTGLLVRLATKLGLHRDPAALGLSPFSSEMRRRLWWQICILDVRTAEDNDLEPLICEHNFNTKLPANVNDADLDISMKQPVAETCRRTEMLYTLVRIEISYAARKLVFSTRFCVNNGYPILSSDEKNSFIDSVLNNLEEKYLRYCEDTIPICNLATTSARMVLAKIKLTLSHPACNGSVAIAPERLNDLVMSSIEIIEYAHTLRTDAKYSKWVWLFQKYIEWDAVAFLLHSLSAAPLPTLLDRAWKAVETFFTVWQGQIQDGEDRWQRLERFRFKAAAKQSPQRSDPSSDATSVVREFDRGLSEPVPINQPLPEPIQSHAELATPLDRDYVGQSTIDGAGDAYIVPAVTNAQHVDWNFDNVSYITQAAPSWEMELDDRAFNSWL